MCISKTKLGAIKKKYKEMTLLFFKLFAVLKRETRESHVAPEMPGSLETKLADCPPKVASRFFFFSSSTRRVDRKLNRA